MAEPDGQPCWCTLLPPAVALPADTAEPAGCWCPACLRRHIGELNSELNSEPKDKESMTRPGRDA
jgi:hypothetical protein